MHVVVLGGAGAMGQVVVRDLLDSKEVSRVVIGELDHTRALAFRNRLPDDRLSCKAIDASRTGDLAEVLAEASVCVNCTQYYFNEGVMKACLMSSTDYVDLGGLFHTTRKQLELHRDFVEKGKLAILGCGSTPGITNVMARFAADRLDRVQSITVRIGSVDGAAASGFLPPYSLDTILDEATLNPVVFQSGKFREVSPLSGEEDFLFPDPVGPAKTVYTLHSEVATFPTSYSSKGIERAEFRIAFPREFLEKLRFLVSLGLCERDPLLVKGVPVSPRDFLAALTARNASAQAPDDCDIIRVDVVGTREGKPAHYTLFATVRPHPVWGVSAGALDTGVPASIIAQMIFRGEVRGRGVYPPELVVPVEPFFSALAERGIRIETREEISGVGEFANSDRRTV